MHATFLRRAGQDGSSITSTERQERPSPRSAQLKVSAAGAVDGAAMHARSASPQNAVRRCCAVSALDTVECVKRYFKTPAGMPWRLLFIAQPSFPRNLAISLVP